jgi:uncharacterized 2Fe-2S/4Fe-4S cluster protein (DUF4445 family)
VPLITFEPSGKTIDAGPGTPLLEAAVKAGVEIDTPCGGKGACGNCMVKIKSGNADTHDTGILSDDEIAEGYVLACKTIVSSSPLTIEIFDRLGYEDGKFSDSFDDIALIRKDLFPKTWQLDPLVIKWLLNVSLPQNEDVIPDIERITRAIQKDWGNTEPDYVLDVIRKAPDVIRSQDGQVTVTMVRESDRFIVIDIEPGDTTVHSYGIAIDVGTTTIAVQLISQNRGKILGIKTDYNEQIKCGLDIISRINYAREPEKLQELKSLVVNTINRLIRLLCEAREVRSNEIYTAVISGNTTMIHLLLGLNPEYIRIKPYTPVLYRVPYLLAGETGIDINPCSWIYFSPAIGSYVGGDITAGLLCTNLVTDTEEINIYIDIGTNGEIVIGNKDFLLASACSAGPAFEGGGVDNGMRAALGAIERVDVDPATAAPQYITIGNVKPRGICGTGMISLLADLLLTGWITNAGKFNRDRQSEHIRYSGKQGYYILAEGGETANGKPLTISETDIGNIIRAKAAIYSACSLFLKHIGITFDNVNTIYIAGGFGRYIDLSQAAVIGLVPELPHSRFKYIGNASLIGSYMILTSQEYKEKQIYTAKRMTYIDLGSDSEYMNQYTAALFLPHTDLDLFPSVKSALQSIPKKNDS